MIRMIGTTIHLTNEQKEWVESNAINLSKFVRILLAREMGDTSFQTIQNTKLDSKLFENKQYA